MTQHAILNNVQHRDLRVSVSRGAEYGDDIMSALTFPEEFRNVQAYYPIVFQQDDQGGFQPVALFGLQRGENLFLEGSRWDAHYIPLSVQREPFLIGRTATGGQVHIDLDHPRVGDEAGQPLFHDHGGPTEFLEHISNILGMLHAGVESTRDYIQALLKHDLLESFVVDVQFNEDSQSRLVGYHTINQDRLSQLDGKALEELARADHLEPTFMAVASLNHMRDLVERYRKKYAHG
ncbi:MAG: peptidase [Lysobacterales bacterium 14-68-21]|nr:MAG: peptidase [Xanthomonadales bacterium 15-68-25]OZB68492.1 MAG: peptidase [Xanthomonadales bacterium 14-68-21]